ncbi:calcium-translocating P-type ATPase [Eremomyces bilateralis CBS 781.70]|uniref:Calcium-transporting ATPase n=1 Tax=Eremomyces bilateralis CBS 781.70 TaxID=1392243 RepID=A0A6G1FY14_9PEZI|nr:calcium-translocating P-type ATPase [Eremomyces bilateralis CBS 781.70]KAF1810479.1 calcium-translocating P-type ATPase [Eremomyces bilateralis CBS 781.70]
MSDTPEEGRNTPSPGPGGAGKRPRAPTITIDTSAVNPGDEMSDTVPLNQVATASSTALSDDPSTGNSVTPEIIEFGPGRPSDPRRTSDDSKESRPTSPHNISSPTDRYGNGNQFLDVPGRRRGESFDSSNSQTSQDSYGTTAVASPTTQTARADSTATTGGSQNVELVSDKEALQPDPGTEAEFDVDNNKFAFSPGQMSKLLNPKSLSAFRALGGVIGLEKGLRTDRRTGLSMDEEDLDGAVSFEEATTAWEVSPSTTSSDVPDKLARADTTAGRKFSEHSFIDRKRVFSDNRLPERKTKNIFQLAWMAYNDKVLILLTGAAVISLALGLYQTFGQAHGEGEARVEWIEGVAIMVAIVIVVVVGAVNDWKKERQFVKLNKKKEDRFVKVIRNGKTREISVFDILAGEVMLLEPGDLVPVDGIFLEGHNVKCDESSATGESDLLKKTGGEEVHKAILEGRPLKKLDPFIISGAKVSEGVGSFLVTSTGVHSSYGKTMMSLREDSEVTPLQLKLNVLAEYIAKLGGAAALLLFVVLLIEFLAHLKNDDRLPAEKGQNFLNILIVSITVVVVAVPEGLPLAVTLALAFATTRMLKDNNLVRLLRSCETMGNATTVCSDKTGTLTQNRMTIVAGTIGSWNRFGDKTKFTLRANTIGPESESIPEFMGALGDEVKTLIVQSIAINSTAFEGEEDGKPAFIGSKTEMAMLNLARDYLGMGSVSIERSNATIAQMVPFDSARKCMAAVVKLDDGRYRMYVKGASEILLSKATRILDNATKDLSDRPLDAEIREELNYVISSYARRSLRTIALLFRDFDSWPPKGARTMQDDKTSVEFDDVFRDMTWLGVVGIQDPLRDGVREAVQDCQRAGVFVRMVTGDNVETARAIAEDCGILVPGGLVMEGPKFRKLSRGKMAEIIPKLCVLARSSPADKEKLVKRLKEMGETVAVTGDGTNDAPALKAADVGFSMGIAGTEVAKEASAIILMDDNFASIVKALLWGRAVNDAVKKFLQFQITVNITAVALTFISAVASADQSSVLTAVQLLWVNLIMDTFAALALATDPPTPSLLNRKPDPKSAPLITLTMWKMIIGQSIFQLAVTFALHFGGAKILSYDTPEERDLLPTLVFNTFVWMQIFNMFNNRRLDNKFNIFEGIQHNYFFILIATIMIGGQVLIIFVGGRAFHVQRLEPAQWGLSVILGLISIPAGVIIRLIPDELIRKAIPDSIRRRAQPQITVEDENRFEFNQGLLDIREDLSFMKRIHGGRLSSFKYRIKNPREIFPQRSRSASHLSSQASIPSTPNINDPKRSSEGKRKDKDHDKDRTPNASPDKRRRATRSRSNSAFGAAAAMAGVVAGSIGGWSPIDRDAGDGDSESIFNAGVSRSPKLNERQDLEAAEGIELASGTRSEDPVLVPQDVVLAGKLPPSQREETTPEFRVGPLAGKGDDKLVQAEKEIESSKEDGEKKEATVDTKAKDSDDSSEDEVDGKKDKKSGG